MAHILPDPDTLPWCEHGTPLGHRCQWCTFSASPRSQGAPGWTCPACTHSYAPWVPECRHCPVEEPPEFIGKANDPGPIETGPVL